MVQFLTKEKEDLTIFNRSDGFSRIRLCGTWVAEVYDSEKRCCFGIGNRPFKFGQLILGL